MPRPFQPYHSSLSHWPTAWLGACTARGRWARRAQLSEKSLALKAQIKHLEREAEAHAALHAGDRASAEDLAQARGAH